MSDAVADGLDTFERLAARRRTSLLVDPSRPVPDELVERLCRIATWAPNHKRTWPWTFTALTGPARGRLGAAVADALLADGADDAKVAKARTKYERTPTVLVVGCATDPDPERAAEDRDAVAAAVQTLLLAATAAGLASYWGTGRVTTVPAVRSLCGFAATDRIVAVIYLGWPTAAVAVPERPPTPFRTVR